MKDIDLTKCNNLRVKIHAKYKDYETTGRIVVHGDGSSHIIDGHGGEYRAFIDKDGSLSNGIRNFEIVPRDPETYKDWQVGDRVCEDEHRNACYEVIFRSGELVVFKDWNNWASNPTTCSEAFTRFGMRLVLTDIEQQIIEEKRKQEYEPQDGDIVAWKDEEDDGDVAITIYRGNHRGYFTLFANGMTGYSNWNLAMNIVRPATDEEKQMLFDAMAKEGKRWNAEKKVVEDIPKPYVFRKGEPVLVRNHYYELWSLFAYHEQAGDKHIVKTCFQTVLQSQCIPYNERTMHLLGTSEDYKEGE